jgi:GMP synthase (glutamine-hydrolysing)
LPRVLAVNNYPTRERFQRLEESLKEGGAEVTPIQWDRASTTVFNSSDGVVLSGSPDMMSDPKVQAKYGAEVEAIVDSNPPILGVCFGHQMMAHAFGADVVEDGRHVLEMVMTQVVADDPLFEGLPKSIMLLESRHEVVKSLPKGFKLLAISATSKIATMKHPSRQVYGVQFHPERYTKENPDGRRVIGNFVRLLK